MELTKGFVLTCRRVNVLRDFLCQAMDQVEEKDRENAELKQKLEDAKATAYTESVDAGMRERKLRRALYKACANWARYEGILFADEHEVEKWSKMIRKCLKKAEEYR